MAGFDQGCDEGEVSKTEPQLNKDENEPTHISPVAISSPLQSLNSIPKSPLPSLSVPLLLPSDFLPPLTGVIASSSSPQLSATLTIRGRAGDSRYSRYDAVEQARRERSSCPSHAGRGACWRVTRRKGEEPPIVDRCSPLRRLRMSPIESSEAPS